MAQKTPTSRPEDQERGHVLVDALGDHAPGGDDDDHRRERGQQDEPDREAVDAERVPDVEARDPGVLSAELQRRGGEVEVGDAAGSSPGSSPAPQEGEPAPPRRRDRRGRRRDGLRPGSAAGSRCSKDMFLLFADGQRPIRCPGKAKLPGHQADHADDHGQRIPVQIAALQARVRAANAADARAAVDDDAVDHADVARARDPFRRCSGSGRERSR